jgi:hypothetical protein
MQVARQKLAKKHTPIMAVAIAKWPPWCPSPSTAAYNISQHALRDKSMLLKQENIIIFTKYLLAILRHNASSTPSA